MSEDDHDDDELETGVTYSRGAHAFQMDLLNIYNRAVEEWDDWNRAELIAVLSEFITDVATEAMYIDYTEDEEDEDEGPDF